MDMNRLLWDAYHLGSRVTKTAYHIKHTPDEDRAANELLHQIANGEATFVNGNADFEAEFPGLSSGVGVLPLDEQVRVTNNQIRKERELAQKIIAWDNEFWGIKEEPNH